MSCRCPPQEFMDAVAGAADLAAIGPVASAEPSVHAGYDGSQNYLIHTNLLGAADCLEHARRHDAALVFLSSSRVYPIVPLRALPLVRTVTRFVLRANTHVPGVSAVAFRNSLR